MINIRKISPLVRAIGTMGAVAAIAGGITFAQLTSNTVALSPNTLTTDTASILIGTGITDTTCDNAGDTAPGVVATSFKPGDPATTVNFCLDNTSDFSQTLTANIPQTPMNSDAAAATTFTITCTIEGTLTSNLNTWGPGTFANPLPANTSDACTASAALSGSYTGSGVSTIPGFVVNFVGTQVET